MIPKESESRTEVEPENQQKLPVVSQNKVESVRNAPLNIFVGFAWKEDFKDFSEQKLSH